LDVLLCEVFKVWKMLTSILNHFSTDQRSKVKVRVTVRVRRSSGWRELCPLSSFLPLVLMAMKVRSVRIRSGRAFRRKCVYFLNSVTVYVYAL